MECPHCQSEKTVKNGKDYHQDELSKIIDAKGVANGSTKWQWAKAS